MQRKKLIKRLIYLILFIFVINFVANNFYWYSSIWYFDMIMHFLGGFWVGLTAFYFFSPRNISLNFIFKVLLFVIVVGVGWEVFEIFVNEVIARSPLNYLDIISDIFFDLAGGALAIFYFYKRIILGEESRVESI